MVTHSPPPTHSRPSQQPQKQAVRQGFSGFIDTFSSAAAGVARSPSAASSSHNAPASTSTAFAAAVVPSEDVAFESQTSDQSLASSPLPPPRSVVIPPPPFSPPPDMSLNESAAITVTNPLALKHSSTLKSQHSSIPKPYNSSHRRRPDHRYPLHLRALAFEPLLVLAGPVQAQSFCATGAECLAPLDDDAAAACVNSMPLGE